MKALEAQLREMLQQDRELLLVAEAKEAEAQALGEAVLEAQELRDAAEEAAAAAAAETKGAEAGLEAVREEVEQLQELLAGELDWNEDVAGSGFSSVDGSGDVCDVISVEQEGCTEEILTPEAALERLAAAEAELLELGLEATRLQGTSDGLAERAAALSLSSTLAEQQAATAFRSAEGAVAERLDLASDIELLKQELGIEDPQKEPEEPGVARGDGGGGAASASPSGAAPASALPETDEEGGGADEKESLAGDFAVPETKKSSTFQAASFFSSSSKKAKKSAWLEVLNFCAKATLARIVPVVVSAVAAVAALGLARRYVPAALRPVPAAMQLVKERVREGFQGVQQMAEATAEVTAEATAEVLSAEPKDEAEGALQEVLWLLATCVAVVPFISEMPGGSSVLGFLMGGALIGPHALGIVQNVNTVSHIAEFGVVFLMFNIGLELSLERLQSMQKYVFGLGSVQVLSCALAISVVSVYLYGMAGPASVLVGCGLALSSTAVALQVLQDRGESNNRHGRATFSALLFQDLAVVLFLMMIPLLANSVSGGAVGLRTIGAALGQAGLKSVVCITGIILGGRLMFRPIYKRIAATQNAEVFRATTLLVALGTSELTQMAGLSMELGAFLAGLLLAETEYHLQIESDIAPFRGLLLGLFFMTIGMQISFSLLVEQFSVIMGALFALLVGKSLLILAAGWAFGLSRVSALRTGLYLASGGEFAFVLFGQAQAAGIVSAALCNQLFLVVALSMACTPLLGTLGHFVSTRVTSSAKLQLQPQEGDVDDLKGHVIIAGYGRVGQIIAQVLSERLISFVAVDVRSDNVMKGRNAEVPVYFGDAGSEQVLSTLGAKRASCAVVALDSPGANYRAVWNLSKNYPHLKIFVRARDIAHGLSLEKAGATAVVPETLEPSLQLASAALEELGIPSDEVAASMDNFRREHIAELKELAGLSSGPSFLISSAKTSPPAKEEEAAEPPQEPPAAAVPAPSL